GRGAQGGDGDHPAVTVRVGLVGCGAIARRAHLPAFKKAGTVDVVAFASRTRASAEAASQEWGGGEVHDDWRELVERTDIDAVDICTINSLHAPVAVAAARSAKHVLVEKPMACTVAEADDMVDAAAPSAASTPAGRPGRAPTTSSPCSAPTARCTWTDAPR